MAALLLLGVWSLDPKAYSAPRKAPVASKVAALVDEAFGAMWIDNELEDADIEYAVRAALRAGASPNSRNEEGETLLLQAIENNHESIVRLLLRSGADANAPDKKSGDTPLIRASYILNVWEQKYTPAITAIVRMLLQRRADPNRRNKAGETALTSAAYWGYSDIVAVLLKSGADFRLRNKQGFTPLQLASLPVARGTISFGAPLGAITKDSSEHERNIHRQESNEEKRLATGRAKARHLLKLAGAKN